MDPIIHDLVSKLERLEQNDKDGIVRAIQQYCGVTVNLTLDGLRAMTAEQLETIAGIVNGIILTREHAPNMKRAYESLQGERLPRKVSFGRSISEEE